MYVQQNVEVFSNHGYLETNQTRIEPSHEKTNNLDFQPGPAQADLYSHRSRIEA